jgi:hypothetical protein
VGLVRQQNAGQDRDVLSADKPFEIVAKFKCLGIMITSENYIHEGT